jgi:hypothetical protein
MIPGKKHIIKNLKITLNKIPIPPIIDQNDYRVSLFLAGSGRSGTTWLQEIINYDNDYRLMFEPFYPEKVDILRHWELFQYLSPSNNEPEYLEPTKKILSGDIRNKWIDKYNRKLFPKKRVIKDIRANLFLYWIKQKFPEIPIIFIMRHPCAVANSKLQGNWDHQLNNFFSQQDLISDFLQPFQNEINDLNSNFEKHIFSWCIENYIPLKQFRDDEMHLIFYENLCTNPEKEIKDLFAFIGKNYDSKVLKHVFEPSLETSNRSAIVTGSNLISSWRQKISNDQITRTVEILSMFGLDRIYNDGNSPLLSGRDALNTF